MKPQLPHCPQCEHGKLTNTVGDWYRCNVCSGRWTRVALVELHAMSLDSVQGERAT